jgi:hypothetical protein
VILTNEAIFQFKSKPKYDFESQNDENNFEMKVELGNTWHHSVNTRFLLENNVNNFKQIVVEKSPLCKKVSFFYEINDFGFVEKNFENENDL